MRTWKEINEDIKALEKEKKDYESALIEKAGGIKKGNIVIVNHKPFIVNHAWINKETGLLDIGLERRNRDNSIRLSSAYRKTISCEDIVSCRHKIFKRDSLEAIMEQWSHPAYVTDDMTVKQAEEVRLEHERIRSKVMALCPHDFGGSLFSRSDNYCQICGCEKEES